MVSIADKCSPDPAQISLDASRANHSLTNGWPTLRESVLRTVRPVKAGMISGSKSHRGKSPSPVA